MIIMQGVKGVKLRRGDDGTVTVVGTAPDLIQVPPAVLAELDPVHVDEYGHLRLDTAGTYRYRPTHLQAGPGEAGCVVVFHRIAAG